jgi:serine/threonine protein kinase
MLAVDNCVNADYLDLVVVFSDDGKVECFNRKDLIDTIEQEGKCDYSSAVLIKNFHNFSLFQKYFLEGVCHYRPIKRTVQSYIEGLLSTSMIKKKGNRIEKHELGKGQYGTVIQYGDSTIAVKISNPPFAENLDALAEYNIMKLLQQSPCCNAFAYDMTINSKGASLYMKSMKGSLNSFLNELNGREKEIMFDICKGIYYAQSMGILHRDLKMENILIDAKGGANVADWGLGAFKPYDNINFNVQTLTYRAPEVMFPFLFGKRYSYPIDIFSLGVLGIELYTKTPHSTVSYQGGDLIDNKELQLLGLGRERDYVSIIVKNIYGITTKKQLMDIAEEKFPVVYMQDSVSDKTGYALFSSMMSNRPKDRPTISQVLNHPYFDDVRNEEKFPEIKEADIFSRIPTPLISGTGDFFSKVEALRMISRAFPHDAVRIFHTINVYNQYTSIYPPTTDKNNKLIVKAFINIVVLFREGPVGSLDIDNVLETEMITILQRLKYEFIRAVPIMYFKILTPRIIRMLLAFELSNYRDIHPYHVAEFIAKRGKEYGYVSQKKSYETPDAFLEELIVSACSTKEKGEQFEKLLSLIL